MAREIGSDLSWLEERKIGLLCVSCQCYVTDERSGRGRVTCGWMASAQSAGAVALDAPRRDVVEGEAMCTIIALHR
jgi:hypothetical protein